MKNVVRALCLSACLLPNLFSQAAAPLTNEIVIRMVQSGVPSDVIIRTIAAAPAVAFSFLPGDLAAFAQYKVPDDVFKAMAAKSYGRPIPGQEPAPVVQKSPAPQQAPGPLRRTSTQQQPRSSAGSRAPVDFHRAEVFGGYSYANIDTNGLTSRQSMNGWEGSIAVNANRWIAGEGDVSGYYKGSVLGSAVSAHSYAFLGGPRINVHPIFFHALFGAERLTGSAFGLSASQNSFAAAFGGGAEGMFSNHWGVRGGADYVLTRHNLFGGPGVTQNNFRVGGGLVYAFGH